MKTKKKGKGRRPRRSRRNDNRRLWLSLGTLLALLIAASAILLYLEVHRERLGEWLRPAGRGRSGLTAGEIERRNQQIDEALRDLLKRQGIGPDRVRARAHREPLTSGSFLFKRIEVSVPEAAEAVRLTGLVRSLVREVPGASLLVRREVVGEAEQTTLTVRVGGRGTRQVVWIPGGPVAPPGKAVRVAVIVDDIGESLSPVRELLSLDVPLTFSILPGRKHSVEAARLIHGRDREILLHLPMEPLNPERAPAGLPLLTVDMGPDEIRARLKDFLDQVPYISGVNNHMGSRFTRDRERMDTVLEKIRERGLFFVDSLTIADSVAFEESRRLGLVTGRRDIFLDHVERPESVALQVRRLIALARERGWAIAICHPKRITIQGLRRAVAEFRSEGVEVVPVSELIG